jgi:hypothetical protein
MRRRWRCKNGVHLCIELVKRRIAPPVTMPLLLYLGFIQDGSSRVAPNARRVFPPSHQLSTEHLPTALASPLFSDSIVKQNIYECWLWNPIIYRTASWLSAAQSRVGHRSRHQTPKQQTSDIRHQTSDTRHPTPDSAAPPAS